MNVGVDAGKRPGCSRDRRRERSSIELARVAGLTDGVDFGGQLQLHTTDKGLRDTSLDACTVQMRKSTSERAELADTRMAWGGMIV